MIDKKPSKVGTTILEAMDDLSAAVDDFGAKLDQLLDQIIYLNTRLVTVDDRLKEIEEKGYAQEKISGDIESTVSEIKYQTQDLDKAIAALTSDMPYVQEVVENMRRQELNDMRFDARVAMGKVKFIQVRT